MVIAFVGTLAKMAKGYFVGIDSFSYGSVSCGKSSTLIIFPEQLFVPFHSIGLHLNIIFYSVQPDGVDYGWDRPRSRANWIYLRLKKLRSRKRNW